MRLEALGAAAPHLREDLLLEAIRAPRAWRRLLVTALEIGLALLAVAALLGAWR